MKLASDHWLPGSARVLVWGMLYAAGADGAPVVQLRRRLQGCSKQRLDQLLAHLCAAKHVHRERRGWYIVDEDATLPPNTDWPEWVKGTLFLARATTWLRDCETLDLRTMAARMLLPANVVQEQMTWLVAAGLALWDGKHYHWRTRVLRRAA